MGTLHYGGSAEPLTIEDGLLAHLKVVIATKLRRGESFILSWAHPDGSGRSTIWLHPAIPLRFVFADPAPSTLDPAWIAQLAATANRSGGVSIAPSDAIDHASAGA
ncbi:MAG: hypothetical protein QM626_12480 [Microbacterium sp.]|uniref:DUF7882 family protein n=1 Tax=Microbacterium sp. TaxID=51671 RepID=UPI0039E2B9AC